MGKNKYKYNEDLFTIDCEEKAYILGFIVADGTVNKTKSNHSIKIYQKEREILDDICIVTGGVVTKPSTRNIYHLNINSKILYEKALTVGLKVNKTYSGIDVNLMRNSIPKEYVIPFFRGLIDGDGCITLTPAESYEFQPCIHISLPDRDLLEWMKEDLNISQSISIRNRENCIPMYSLTIRSGSINLCKMLYQNSKMSLQRKKKRAELIVSFFG